MFFFIIFVSFVPVFGTVVNEIIRSSSSHFFDYGSSIIETPWSKDLVVFFSNKQMLYVATKSSRTSSTWLSSVVDTTANITRWPKAVATSYNRLAVGYVHADAFARVAVSNSGQPMDGFTLHTVSDSTDYKLGSLGSDLTYNNNRYYFVAHETKSNQVFFATALDTGTDNPLTFSFQLPVGAGQGGYWPSIAVLPETGFPVISFQSYTQPQKLKLAMAQSVDGATGTWTTMTVDWDNAEYVGTYSFLFAAVPAKLMIFHRKANSVNMESELYLTTLVDGAPATTVSAFSGLPDTGYNPHAVVLANGLELGLVMGSKSPLAVTLLVNSLASATATANWTKSFEITPTSGSFAPPDPVAIVYFSFLCVVWNRDSRAVFITCNDRSTTEFPWLPSDRWIFPSDLPFPIPPTVQPSLPSTAPTQAPQTVTETTTTTAVIVVEQTNQPQPPTSVLFVGPSPTGMAPEPPLSSPADSLDMTTILVIGFGSLILICALIMLLLLVSRQRGLNRLVAATTAAATELSPAQVLSSLPPAPGRTPRSRSHSRSRSRNRSVSSHSSRPGAGPISFPSTNNNYGQVSQYAVVAAADFVASGLNRSSQVSSASSYQPLELKRPVHYNNTDQYNYLPTTSPIAVPYGQPPRLSATDGHSSGFNFDGYSSVSNFMDIDEQQ